jgi:hypothetical protein
MDKAIKYAFRITHISNIPHIVNYGLVRRNSPYKDNNFVSIGDQTVVRLRSEKKIFDECISEYIPFYFGPRSPMLYVIQHGYNEVKQEKAENIVYCVIKIDDVINSSLDCVFSNGHALSALTQFYHKEQLTNINKIIRYEDVYSSYWSSDVDWDLKRRKEAELLIKNDIPVNFICGYVVFNDEAKNKLKDYGIDPSIVQVMPQYYF